jgi:hypothetical protein
MSEDIYPFSDNNNNNIVVVIVVGSSRGQIREMSSKKILWTTQ